MNVCVVPVDYSLISRIYQSSDQTLFISEIICKPNQCFIKSCIIGRCSVELLDLSWVFVEHNIAGVFPSWNVSEYVFSVSDPQVKVMVRVCPVSQSDAAESSSFLKVDPRKKQITIMDPSANQTQSAASTKKAAANQVPPKMFTFDAAFPPDASQVRKVMMSWENKGPFMTLIWKTMFSWISRR